VEARWKSHGGAKGRPRLSLTRTIVDPRGYQVRWRCLGYIGRHSRVGTIPRERASQEMIIWVTLARQGPHFLINDLFDLDLKMQKCHPHMTLFDQYEADFTSAHGLEYFGVVKLAI
jgi:hypothetical protein